MNSKGKKARERGKTEKEFLGLNILDFSQSL